MVADVSGAGWGGQVGVKELSGASRRTRGRLAVLLGAIAAFQLVGVPGGFAAGRSTGTPGGWIAAWAASPVNASGPGLVDATERMVVRSALGGRQLRVRLSNAFGDRPVTVNDVFVGLSGGSAEVVAGTNQHLTFAGMSSVTIPADVEVWSDPVEVQITARQQVVVSAFATNAPELTTLDDSTEVPSFQAPDGDHAGDLSGAAFTESANRWVLTDGLAVGAPQGASAVVMFGDSLTAGFQLHPTPEVSWPSLLSVRLDASPGACKTSVINAGISGNALTHESPPGDPFGSSGLRRVGRDAFSQPGLRTVVVLLGINDIGRGDTTAAAVIGGYRKLIGEAHAHRIRIVGGTLLPAGDVAQPTPYRTFYSSANGVAEREAVNRWILTSGAFDGVIDFARAVANPRDTNELLPIFDSGDHLHPNSLGYQRMANSVNLATLRSCSASK